MQSEKKARWQELCEQASVEQDPNRLLDLVRQINETLSEQQGRAQPRQAFSAAPALSLSSQEFGDACRFLLVEDNPFLRSEIKLRLAERNPGWEICEAENGRQAIERVLSMRPALVMLDLSLPDVPGYEVARQIREISAATKVILCSLGDSDYLAMVAQHVSADGYFAKDSNFDDLHKLIATVLGRGERSKNAGSRDVA
jgi:two-component system, chemotaxis family, chemotaxis protein CheY